MERKEACWLIVIVTCMIIIQMSVLGIAKLISEWGP